MPVPARLGLVTLGVADLDRSEAFYSALGWERCASSVRGEIAWFRTADSHLGLWDVGKLAEDAGLAGERPARFGGIALAINVDRPEDVAASIETVVQAGGTVLKPATEVPFGVSGYVADPDGHPWEIAYNPDFPIGADGRLHIP